MIARTPDHMETILNFLQHGFVSVGDRSLIPGMCPHALNRAYCVVFQSYLKK